MRSHNLVVNITLKQVRGIFLEFQFVLRVRKLQHKYFCSICWQCCISSCSATICATAPILSLLFSSIGPGNSYVLHFIYQVPKELP